MVFRKELILSKIGFYTINNYFSGKLTGRANQRNGSVITYLGFLPFFVEKDDMSAFSNIRRLPSKEYSIKYISKEEVAESAVCLRMMYCIPSGETTFVRQIFQKAMHLSCINIVKRRSTPINTLSK